MKLVTVKFFNKLGDTSLTATTSGRLEEPRIVAKNWYQTNTNQRLLNNVTIKGDFDKYASFDSVEINGRKYVILDKRENGINGILFEIGSGGRK